MNHDDIVRLYKEISDELCDGKEWCLTGIEGPLVRYAELVKQHIQIEQMAKFEELAEIVRADERERCAKICDQYERANLYGFKEVAARIRNMI